MEGRKEDIMQIRTMKEKKMVLIQDPIEAWLSYVYQKEKKSMREIFGDLIKNIEVNLKLKRWSNPKNKFKIT
jgi:hypothetical protein